MHQDPRCQCEMCVATRHGAAALVFTKENDQLEIRAVIVREGENSEALGHMANELLRNIAGWLKEPVSKAGFVHREATGEFDA